MMTSTPAWIPLASVFIGAVIALSAQIIVYSLNERSKKANERWKEYTDRLRELRQLISQVYHNAMFDRLYASYPSPELQERAHDFNREFVWTIGKFTDLTTLFEGLAPAINVFAGAIGNVRTANHDNLDDYKKLLNDAYMDVLRRIDAANKTLDKEYSRQPWDGWIEAAQKRLREGFRMLGAFRKYLIKRFLKR